MKATGCAGDITVSSNGKEALEYLQSRIQSQGALPDVIFVDLNIPVQAVLYTAYVSYDVSRKVWA